MTINWEALAQVTWMEWFVYMGPVVVLIGVGIYLWLTFRGLTK